VFKTFYIYIYIYIYMYVCMYVCMYRYILCIRQQNCAIGMPIHRSGDCNMNYVRRKFMRQYEYDSLYK